MLTRELMGLIALGVLWVNGLLVIAVAAKQLRGVRAIRARFARAAREGRLLTGVVKEGEVFARRQVSQLGRAITTRGPERILFTDRAQSFEVLGGLLETQGREVLVEAAGPDRSEVWVAPERVAEAIARADTEGFDEAFGAASKYKGFQRDVDIRVRPGDRVWVLGELRDGSIAAGSTEPLFVSMVEPTAWASGRSRLLLGFLVLTIGALVGVTALSLEAPWFGPVSTLGGVLAVVFFLGIQPLGTAVRDAVRTPARQPLGGIWRGA